MATYMTDATWTRTPPDAQGNQPATWTYDGTAYDPDVDRRLFPENDPVVDRMVEDFDKLCDEIRAEADRNAAFALAPPEAILVEPMRLDPPRWLRSLEGDVALLILAAGGIAAIVWSMMP